VPAARPEVTFDQHLGIIGNVIGRRDAGEVILFHNILRVTIFVAILA